MTIFTEWKINSLNIKVILVAVKLRSQKEKRLKNVKNIFQLSFPEKAFSDTHKFHVAEINKACKK